MAKRQYKFILLTIILLTTLYSSWYGVNYYAAGLADQTSLIEYGMEDDFIYCNDWRPKLLDKDKEIRGYWRSQRAINEMMFLKASLEGVERSRIPLMSPIIPKLVPPVIYNVTIVNGVMRRRIHRVDRLPKLVPPVNIYDWAMKLGYKRIMLRLDLIKEK